MRRRFSPLTVASVVSASLWPLADLALANSDMPFGLSSLIWPFATLSATLIFTAITTVFLGSWNRALAVAAPATIAFFSFSAVEPFLRQGLDVVSVRRGAAILFILLWFCLCGALLRATRATDMRRFLLIFPILVLASSVGLAVVGRLTGHQKVSDQAVLSAKFSARPNVYHFLFDAMGRPDTLKAVLKINVGSEPELLSRRGFVFPPAVLAARLETIPSLTSILAPGSPSAEAKDIDIAGSPVALVFRNNGYRIAQYGEVFAFAACKGKQDICLSNTDFSLGEIDIAMVRRTPVYPAISRYVLEATSSRNLFTNLNRIAATVPRRPTYTFSYMVPPHPPFIFGKDCQPDQTDDNDFRAWRKSSIFRYEQAYRCVLQGLIPAVDRIIARDPDAVIIVSGDHGTMFLRPQTDGRPWSGTAIAERRPVFLAARLPERCRTSFVAIEALSDVYPRLFDCL